MEVEEEEVEVSGNDEKERLTWRCMKRRAKVATIK